MLTALILFGSVQSQDLDPNTATYNGCPKPREDYSTRMQNGFTPGLFVTTSNLPGATYNLDGSLAQRKIVCAHMDERTNGGSIIIPWSQFDPDGRGKYDWNFVDSQMKPWVDRGQVVNLLVWPAVQKKDQLFPDGESATPDRIMQGEGMTYQCPDGSAQGGLSEGIPLPKFWKKEVYSKYTRALKAFVRRYEDHPNVNVFRFGIGVGAESYPGNGATTPTNFCMETFVNQFEGNSYEEKAQNAYETWSAYVVREIRAFRRFHSKKPIVVTINSFYTLSKQDSLEFPRMVAEKATEEYIRKGVELPRLGLGVQGATTQGFDEHSSTECYADWCNIFNETKKLGIALQLQTPLHSGVNGRPGSWQSIEECQEARKNNGRYGCTNTGSLVELIDYALSVGVNIFDLYPYEWLVANDSNWNNNPPELNWNAIYGADYRKALDKASNQQLVPAS